MIKVNLTPYIIVYSPFIVLYILYLVLPTPKFVTRIGAKVYLKAQEQVDEMNELIEQMRGGIK